MKIVYVYDSIARIGGMERILTNKMNYLAEIYGHEVYLITSSQGNHPFYFPVIPQSGTYRSGYKVSFAIPASASGTIESGMDFEP